MTSDIQPKIVINTLLFVQLPSDIPQLRQWLHKQSGILTKNSRFVALTHDSATALDTLNLPYLSYLTLKRPRDRDKKIEVSESLAEQWFQGINSANNHGIELGRIVYRDFSLFLRSLFEICNLLIAAMEVCQPSQCVAVSSPKKVTGIRMSRTERISADILEILCIQQGIPCEVLFSRPKSVATPNLKRWIKSLLTPLLSCDSQRSLKRLEAAHYKKRIIFSGGLQQLGDLMKYFEQDATFRPIFLRDIWSFDYSKKLKTRKIPFLVAPLPGFKKSFKIQPAEKEKLQSFFIYRGFNLSPIVMKRINFLFCTFFPQLGRLVAHLQKILSNPKPRLIVVDEDVCEFNKILLSVGNQLGIPGIVVQHGAHGLPQGFYPGTASHMAVWGDLSFKKFAEWGIEPERMTVTGVSKYDKLIQTARPARVKDREFCKRLGISDKKPLILVCPGISAANPFEKYHEHVSSFEENIAMIRETLNALGSRENVQIVIKLHQRDRDEKYISEMISRLKLRAKVLVLKNCDTTRLLQSVDLLIASYSSVVIEAMILDVPIITTNFSGEPDLMPYAEFGGAVGISRPGAMERAIDEVMSQETVQQQLAQGRKLFLKKFIFQPDGKSTARIAQLFRELASQT